LAVGVQHSLTLSVRRGATFVLLRRSSPEGTGADAGFRELDLVLGRAALVKPLAPGNWTTVRNDALAPEIIAQSLCATGQAKPDRARRDAAGRRVSPSGLRNSPLPLVGFCR
jgi:hypothetical protein